MDAKDQIKQKLDIVDIIGEYMQLKKAGANYRGLCPFHNEKSPSFMVSQDKQIYHCFGCSEGGDLISFVQKIEHCEFIEALKILAPKAGVTLNEFEPKQQTDKKAATSEINRLAAKFYNQVLKLSAQAQKARDYLKKRGLSELTIDSWQIGYSPETWDTALKALKTKKFNEQQIVESGLAIRAQQGKVYDRFRNRIMFPICNQRGQVVGFTSRIIDAKDEQFGGKYVNSPQTEIFNKSEVIFGLDKAKESIKKNGYAILMEGNMDVITSHQAGVTNAVATSGTALTAGHVQILKRYTDSFYFCFDGDSAGQQALLRAFQTAAPMEVNCYAVILPTEVNGMPVKDPDDLIKASPEEWLKAIKAKVPVIDYFIAKAMAIHDLTTDTGQKSALNYIFPIISSLQNQIQINYWLAQLSKQLSIKQDLIEEAYNKAYQKTKSKQKNIISPSLKPQTLSSREQKLGARLYSILATEADYLEYFSSLPLVKQYPELEYLADDAQRRLFKALLMYYNASGSFNYQNFLSSLGNDAELTILSNNLALSFEQGSLDTTSIKGEILAIVGTLQELHGKKTLSKLQNELSLAEKSGDASAIDRLMKEIAGCNALINQTNAKNQKA